MANYVYSRLIALISDVSELIGIVTEVALRFRRPYTAGNLRDYMQVQE
jgi:hypothetical protein